MTYNAELSHKYLVTIFNSENKQFPYFVEEWDECFTEEEIKNNLKDYFDFVNIAVGEE